MKKALLISALALSFLSGCDHIGNSDFEIVTTDGKTITLTCPVVDKGRSTFTYLIDSECRVTGVKP